MSQVQTLTRVQNSSITATAKKAEPTKAQASLIQRVVAFVKANPFKTAALVAGTLAGVAGLAFGLGFIGTVSKAPLKQTFAEAFGLGSKTCPLNGAALAHPTQPTYR